MNRAIHISHSQIAFNRKRLKAGLSGFARRTGYVAIIGLWVVMTSCKNDHYRQHAQPKASLCLSFDDYSVDEWFSLREMFLKYRAHVTFFVTRFDTLSAEQVAKLRILQHDGHEIAYHGAKHVLSEHYIKEHSMDQYLREEIVKGLKVMADSGFRVTSFAYPYSAKYWFTDQELLPYFYVLRNSVRLEGDITKLDEIYYPFDGGRLVEAVSIDKGKGLDKEKVAKAMQRAKEHKEALVLHGHQPDYSFDRSFLEDILRMANENGLDFLTVSDLVIG